MTPPLDAKDRVLLTGARLVLAVTIVELALWLLSHVAQIVALYAWWHNRPYEAAALWVTLGAWSFSHLLHKWTSARVPKEAA